MRRLPDVRYLSDNDRYIVMCGDDRAGFVRKTVAGEWSAVDTTMEKSKTFRTRRGAGEWLRRELEKAIYADHVR